MKSYKEGGVEGERGDMEDREKAKKTWQKNTYFGHGHFTGPKVGMTEL